MAEENTQDVKNEIEQELGNLFEKTEETEKPEAEKTESSQAQDQEQEPEFEIEPGKKHKRSEILAWREAHGLKDKLEKEKQYVQSLIALDQYLSQNPKLAQVVLSVLTNQDENKLKKLMALFGLGEGEGEDTESENKAEDLEKTLDLEDPSIKALYQRVKDLQEKLAQYESRISAEDESRSVAEAEKYWQSELDRVWNENQFGKVLETFPKEDQEGMAKNLKSQILSIVLTSDGTVSIDEAAKTVKGWTDKLVQGVVKGYTTKKESAPPMGGKSGQAVTTPATAPKLGEESEKAIIKELERMMSERE